MSHRETVLNPTLLVAILPVLVQEALQRIPDCGHELGGDTVLIEKDLSLLIRAIAPQFGELYNSEPQTLAGSIDDASVLTRFFVKREPGTRCPVHNLQSSVSEPSQAVRQVGPSDLDPLVVQLNQALRPPGSTEAVFDGNGHDLVRQRLWSLSCGA